MEKSRQEAVKDFFENTSDYFRFDYNLRIRKETLESFTKNLHFNSVLDVPCGNGEISKVLLPRTKRLLMMDISENMSRLAQNNVPAQFARKAEVQCADLFSHDFKNEKFDLVVCFGLMAHVESPLALLEKLSLLVSGEGYLIFQNTDSAHFYNYLIRVYLASRSLVKKQSYALNKVSSAFVESELGRLGFEKIRAFRYNQSFLGFSNLFSNERKYALTRRYFGTADEPNNQRMGSDVTYLFKKRS